MAHSCTRWRRPNRWAAGAVCAADGLEAGEVRVTSTLEEDKL